VKSSSGLSLAMWRVGFLALLVAAWEATARLGIVAPLFFSMPSAVASAGAALVQQPAFWRHFLITGVELFVAFALAVVVGVGTGFVIGGIRYLRDVCEPYLLLLFAFPKIAVIPLFILWFGMGFRMIVVYGAVTAALIISVNVVAGFRQVRPQFLRAARSMGARRLAVHRKIVLPSLIPVLFAGLKVGLNFAILSVLVAELVVADRGVGAFIDSATTSLRTDQVYAAIVVLAVFVAAVNALLGSVERRVSAWRYSPATRA
jgi:NitT/TauT family transport system permease protein